MGAMFAVLLRASSDQKVWTIVQGSTLVVDIALLATLYTLLVQQGRLDVKLWNGLDWFNVIFPSWVTLIRVAYLLGIGDAVESGAKKVL
jgi:hypothetical protein